MREIEYPPDGYRKRWPRWRKRVLAAIFCLPLAAISLSGYALASGLLILYPEARSPYEKVYQDIVKGVMAAFKGPSNTEMIRRDYNNQLFTQTLSRINPDLLLALGRESLKQATDAAKGPLIFVGAVPGSIDGFAGVSMTPDARLVLDKLLLLAPDIRNVHVVVAPGVASNDLAIAAEYLGAKGKRLIRQEASTVVQAAESYRQITATATLADAVWILQGDKLVDSTLLSFLLDAAWNKHFIIFSSNPSHVRRGTLFAVFPDNYRMGEQIGVLANKHMSAPGSVPAQLEPLRHVLLGVNERTVNHLGLNLTESVRRRIDLVL